MSADGHLVRARRLDLWDVVPAASALNEKLRRHGQTGVLFTLAETELPVGEVICNVRGRKQIVKICSSRLNLADGSKRQHAVTPSFRQNIATFVDFAGLDTYLWGVHGTIALRNFRAAVGFKGKANTLGYERVFLSFKHPEVARSPSAVPCATAPYFVDMRLPPAEFEQRIIDILDGKGPMVDVVDTVAGFSEGMRACCEALNRQVGLGGYAFDIDTNPLPPVHVEAGPVNSRRARVPAFIATLTTPHGTTSGPIVVSPTPYKYGDAGMPRDAPKAIEHPGVLATVYVGNDGPRAREITVFRRDALEIRGDVTRGSGNGKRRRKFKRSAANVCLVDGTDVEAARRAVALFETIFSEPPPSPPPAQVQQMRAPIVIHAPQPLSVVPVAPDALLRRPYDGSGMMRMPKRRKVAEA